MYVIILCILFLSHGIYCSSNEQGTNNEKSKYEVFAHKYQSVFGEKPSKKIWNLGRKQKKKGLGDMNASCANCCPCTPTGTCLSN